MLIGWVMFRAADLVLLSKADFLDVIDDFDPARAEQHVRELANLIERLAILYPYGVVDVADLPEKFRVGIPVTLVETVGMYLVTNHELVMQVLRDPAARAR